MLLSPHCAQATGVYINQGNSLFGEGMGIQVRAMGTYQLDRDKCVVYLYSGWVEKHLAPAC